MKSYLTDHDKRDVYEPLDNRQVKNSDGAYVYQVDYWALAYRFLVLGSEGGTYYSSERDITKVNVRNLETCIQENGPKFVHMLLELRDRVPKRDTIFYGLALACAKGERSTKFAVEVVFRQVVRTGSDLLMFVAFVDGMRGWGRFLKRLVGDWYDRHRAKGSLAYQVLKYQNRNGWTHKDVLRRCHYAANDSILRWVVGADLDDRVVVRGKPHKDEATGVMVADHKMRYASSATEKGLPEILTHYEQLKRTTLDSIVGDSIISFGYTHEMIPNQWKNSPYVWECLLQRMPMIAMIRNLGKMTQVGLLKPLTESNAVVIDHLRMEGVQKSKVHPIQLLMAYSTYKQGHGVRGNLSWDPVPQITDALEKAFYYSFGNIEPSNKATLIAVDVSPSMDGNEIAGCPGLTPREAAMCLAMVTARTEPNYHIVAFAGKMEPLGITANDSLAMAIKAAKEVNWSWTDISLPFAYALEKKLNVDTFIVLTDNETNSGEHPKEVLNEYRRKFNPNARLIVVGMVANHFTVADPEDRGMLDIVGFDTSAPQIMSDFASGNDVELFKKLDDADYEEKRPFMPSRFAGIRNDS